MKEINELVYSQSLMWGRMMRIVATTSLQAFDHPNPTAGTPHALAKNSVKKKHGSKVSESQPGICIVMVASALYNVVIYTMKMVSFTKRPEKLG